MLWYFEWAKLKFLQTWSSDVLRNINDHHPKQLFYLYYKQLQVTIYIKLHQLTLNDSWVPKQILKNVSIHTQNEEHFCIFSI